MILSPYDTTELNHGGKVDLSGIINFLKELEHEILLIAIDRNDDVTKEGITSKRKKYWRYIFSFSKYPYMAYSRQINQHQKKAIYRFNPDIVFIMTEFMLPAYLQLKNLSHHKTILRRANNEKLYLKSLLSFTNPFLSIYRLLEITKMNFLQEVIMKTRINLTIDIAPTGVPAPSQIVISGPINSRKKEYSEFRRQEQYDFGYIGSLNLPNAKQGITWFIESVVPEIQSRLPGVRIMIAGKNPGYSLKKKCKKSGILLFANPADVTHLNEEIKVFVNPVFKGSGVNMKLLTPIKLKKPIVSTFFGARGFPEIDNEFGTANDSASFAKLCLKIHRDPINSQFHANQVLDAYNNRINHIYKLIEAELNSCS